MKNKKIVLGISGGIAAYKSPELVRLLIKAGAEVQVVMTQAATKFVTETTMQAVSGNPVFVSQWDPRVSNGMAHIELSRNADAILIAPVSADMMAKHSLGLADDLLSTLCVARGTESGGMIVDCPLLMAPAMNLQMWNHPATKRSVERLQRDGVHLLGPASGDQACGEVGMGRMLEPVEIIESLIAFFQKKLLQGKKVLITAGPTFEPIDPVRGITNRSSGKMGFAIARAAIESGAEVHLITGPVALDTPLAHTGKIQRTDVETAEQMLNAVLAAKDYDIFFSVAAVADWKIKSPNLQKIKKNSSNGLSIEFEENADILFTIASRVKNNKPFCVGFAAETENIEEYGKTKLKQKKIPMLIANHGPSTFGSNENQLILIEANGSLKLARSDKLSLSREIIAKVSERLV